MRPPASDALASHNTSDAAHADIRASLLAVESSGGPAKLGAANTFTQPQTVKGNVYQRDANDQLLVTLAPTANSVDAFGGQVLLHGSASGEVNKRLWYWAVDVVAAVPYRDSVWGKILDNGNASDVDGIYISHGGAGPATIGIGIAQPEASGAYHRVKIQGASNTEQAAGGVLQLRQGTGAPTGAILRATSVAGTDRWLLDPTNGNTWTVRQRGDAATANPVWVVENVTDNTERLRITANGKLQWANPADGVPDPNALLSRSGAGLLQVAQNLAVGNLCGVGPAFTAGGVTPTAQMDVATTGATACNLYVRNTTQGAMEVTMAGSGFEGRLYTSNASLMKIGTNRTARITIGGTGNVSFQSANKPTLPAAATDLASAIALVNSLKSMATLYTLAA